MPPNDFLSITGQPSQVADYLYPGPSPDPLLAPGLAQAPPGALTTYQQSVLSPEAPQPVPQGWGAYRVGDQTFNKPSTKKKILGTIASSILGLGGNRAGAQAAEDVFFNQPLKEAATNWAADEAARQRRIKETGDLAKETAAIGEIHSRQALQAAQAQREQQLANAEAVNANVKQRVPDPVALGKALGMEPEALAPLSGLDDATKTAVAGALVKRFENGEKTTDMSFMAPVIADAIGLTDPAHLESFTNGLKKTSDANFGHIMDFVKSQIKPEKEASLDKQDADLTAKLANGTITPAERIQLKAVREARTRVPAATFYMNNPVSSPDIVKQSVDTIKQNPDVVNEVMKEAKGNGPLVQKQFTQETGLPLPQPLKGTAVDQERAARNALDAASAIQEAMKNPEVRSRLGPILGRLGNVEQAIGTAVGLSPQAEQVAQELRTRMRYFVFQEGRAILSGRMPAQLMQQLETSSASVKMDPNMLQGALKGATDNALSVLDNSDKQRFGGKMRTRTDRGLPESSPVQRTVRMRATNGQIYDVPNDKVPDAKQRGAVEVK